MQVDERLFDEQIEELLKGRRYTSHELNKKIEEIQSNYPNVPIKRVCSYGRVSTKHDEQKTSLINQNQIFHKVCESKASDGWVLVEEVYDRKSATYLPDRKKFLYIIDKAKRGDFDILLFKDSKRFSRNTNDFLDLIEELKVKYKVFVYFINEGICSESATREQLTILGMMAESLSNGLHISVTKAIQLNMERELGRMTHSTFGYDKPTVRDSSVCYINEYEADLIRELFTRLKANEGFTSICEDWRKRGIKTKKGKETTLYNLRRYARNEKYIGKIIMHKDCRPTVRDKRTPTNEEEWIIRYREDLRIIDDSLFYEVQDIIDGRSQKVKDSIKKKPITRNRMLTGVIKCACCGKSFKRTVGGSSNRNYGYFACDTYRNRHKQGTNITCTNNTYIRQDELNYCLALYFKELLEKQDGLRELVKNKIVTILKEQDKIKVESVSEFEIANAEERFKRAKELFIEGDISREQLNKYKNELADLKSKVNISSISSISDSDVDQMVDRFCNNLEECVQLGLDENSIDGYKFNRLFESIIASNGELEIVFKLNDSPLVDIESGRCTVKGGNRISLESLIDWGFVRDSCLEEVNRTEQNKVTYRFSNRLKLVGSEFRDKIYLVI